MDFSIMFWGDLAQGTDPNDKYRLMLDVARYADEHGYAALWVPERHFHPWGGLFPNPAVLCSALAMVTKRIRLRAGSVVLPLHNPIRVAEEWSVVDNLSGGRVEIALATGWKDDDFVLAPEAYATRRQNFWSNIETVQQLWRGGTHTGKNGSGRDVEVATFPRPVQEQLPTWVTSFGAIRTMASAGNAGFNLLTHLLGQTYADVQHKVQQYNAYRVRGGFKERGKVALMLHTYIGTDLSEVIETVREPFMTYLKHSAELAIPSELRKDWETLSQEQITSVIEQAFKRYFDTASLVGTPDTCRAALKVIQETGITDVCCLVDFGLEPKQVLASLEFLTELKSAYEH